MKATGTVSAPKNTESVIFEPGTYNAKLVEMFLVAGTKYQSDEAQIEAVFRWELDPEASPVRDGLNKVGYVSVNSPAFDPKNPAQFEFQTERKYAGKFQQRLEALVGQMLTAEDARQVGADIDAPDFVTNFDELLAYLQEADEQGRPRRAMVKSFKISGRELIGAEALITLSIIEKSRNGQKAEYQKIENVTAIPRARGPRRAAPAEDQPVEAPQRLMDPPAPRRATTEPDLPF
ncbi:hypothetical protein [Deinococcus sp. DB0503]|uniref:hypothetical protein n=1 Tax=Deinococcus sp. DB0503 TaxID=2479203 RepID=UPI0018E037C6|nr:hypothetical protein [Deinococcus sp. DB0503]MBI0447204.1 hypothetical protein [Deinococcus sp. DB0503]